MPTIVIVGAGAGLGLSIGKVFGRNGYNVALVARDQTKLDALATQLCEYDIEAAGFTADLMDRPSLVDAFDRIKQRFGTIDVLEYSPAPHRPVPGITMAGPLEATVDNLQPQIDFYLHGAVTATQQVLPAMRERGAGTLLYTTGASSVQPNPMMGNVGPAAAALRNWALSLHQALDGTGVYVAHVPLSVWIGAGGPETQPDNIAELYWTLHTKRTEAEHLYTAAP
ncbi:short-chain dehydrogenase [Actinoplanes sp. ATCC 53533]|uniref:SDR family NAD(P)-dependent oxidoreductase n=1 Tax=Actinoplanes sp. ATCC 53533 TaxID=1288362 RepID=UPI000F79F694|nr:SDR family NAD(P)-dependent oxidoreductase [Actinoplanes sp. ATCC 53533]RSM64531.1 short-chain dehydrogenase [Actinoplanes sp. ATCC 53533]